MTTADRNALVMQHQGLVHLTVNPWIKAGQIPEHLADDAKQEGFLALMRAVELFDPSHGAQFSTYAGRAIRSQVGRYVRRYRSAVTVPANATGLRLETVSL